MPLTIVINRKTLLVASLNLLLLLTFVLDASVWAQDGRYKLKHDYLEARRTSYPLSLSVAGEKGDVSLVDEYKIKGLPENEFLNEWPRLKNGFQAVELEIEASHPIFEKHNFQINSAQSRVLGMFGLDIEPRYEIKKKVDRTKGLETSLDLERVKIETRYKEEKEDEKQTRLKQDIYIENNSQEDLSLSFLLKHKIEEDEVTWNNQTIPLTEVPKELSRPGWVSFGSYPKTFTYDFSDVPQKFSPEFWVQKREGKNLLMLFLRVDMEPGSSVVIDPVYNFVDVTQESDDYYAYEDWGATVFAGPDDAGQGEASNTAYEALAVEDGVRWETAGGSTTSEEYNAQLYKFYIENTAPSALNFKWYGYGNTLSSFGSTLSAWDYDASNWVVLATGNNTSQANIDLVFSETSNPGKYIKDADGEVVFKVETESKEAPGTDCSSCCVETGHSPGSCSSDCIGSGGTPVRECDYWCDLMFECCCGI